MSGDTSEGQRRLEGKVAIITGGASGIGEATARLFAAHGAKVVVADIQDDAGRRVAKELGGRADYFHCDVREESHIEAMVDFTVKKHGCLDVMFNNAGISGGSGSPIADLDVHDFDSIMQVNVRGVLLGVKHAARVMIPRNAGSIICTASVSGILTVSSNHAYTVSKHAVIAIAKLTATELGKFGIRVNCISPFAIPTPMFFNVSSDTSSEDMARAIQDHASLKGVSLGVEDVAKAALFLATDDGRYISGHNLVIDGAYTVSKPWNPFNN